MFPKSFKNLCILIGLVLIPGTIPMYIGYKIYERIVK